MVQKHAARNLHYDLRLEMEGVLRSWAVPKGPSPDPADKRLAVLVEDHPVEYADFEGLIPAGNYGAGAVILWDRGRWVPIGDTREGLEKGKLLFELHGLKLHGLWTLVKLKKGDKEWLLIKERDAHVEQGGQLPERSVLSGLTVEELRDGVTPTPTVRAKLERFGARQREVSTAGAMLMLAETTERAFTKPGWIFELKLDGYRMAADKRGAEVRLLTRNGQDYAPAFPEVVRAVRALPGERLVLDGELVVLDDTGRPSFQRLQGRARLHRAVDVRHAAVDATATLFAFDLPGFEEYDLRALPLVDRKAVLRDLVPALGVVRYLDHFEEDGELLFQNVERLGLEGIMAKRGDSQYRAGRSAAWLKIRTSRSDDFVVVGYTAPKGTREGLGALHLARDVDGELVYSGRVGTGFTGKQLAELRRKLEPRTRPTPPCTGPVPKERGTTWVEPELVCEVTFTERTDEGLLRQPVLVRMRDDKVVEPRALGPAASRATASRLNRVEASGDPAPPRRQEVPVREVVVSNRNKVFWPADGYTKGDLVEYYREVSPWLLPYLRDRPVVLTRYPDGIEGKSFFQKDAPPFVPEWLRTERMWSEQAAREIDYFVCDDVESLLYLANMASIPLHIWSSRAATLDYPDWCVLDLDPKAAPFSHVLAVAKATRALCDRIGLPCFVKTSGSSGLHVLVPLGPGCSHEHARSLGELLARVIVDELPEVATIARQISRRDGRVYVDYLQNGAGKLIVAPFSVRPLPGAPVSMPLEWREVNGKLDIRKWTIRTSLQRVGKWKKDPLGEVLELDPDLPRVLARLTDALSGAP